MMKKHAAELLLDIRLHPKADKVRKTKRFLSDMQSTNAILLNPEKHEDAKDQSVLGVVGEESALHFRPVGRDSEARLHLPARGK
jgi:hypothetical protein